MTIEKVDALIKAVQDGIGWYEWLPHDDALPEEWILTARDAYGGSLDAAKKLHDILLPGWGWTLNATSGTSGKYAQDATVDVINPFRVFGANAVTPARAWLLAILRAYRAELP